MQIETDRLTLRPLSPDDTAALTTQVFSDPSVVAMLAHDTRTQASAVREAKVWTTKMGLGCEAFANGGLGLFALLVRGADDAFAGAAGCYMERGADGLWHGEYFYALGRAWHRQGLMGEAAEAISERLRAIPDLGVIYGVYWDGINEASGKILRRSGLVPAGRHPVLEEYPPDRCRGIAEFDLWRLERAGEDRTATAVEVTRRIGAFVAEGLFSRDEALGRIARACAPDPMPSEALEMFDWALANPGMAYLELRGPRAA